MKHFSIGMLGSVLVALCCGSASTSAPTQAVFRSEKLAELDAAVLQAIADRQCPGGVLWVEHHSVSYHKAFGKRALVPAAEPMTEDTIFDAASLTKVVACGPAVMLLVERGQVKLDERVQVYLPEFKGGGKENITVRQMLTHVSGLRPDIETKSDWTGQAAAIQKACEEKLQSPPGTVFRYSDINFFLLGEIVQRVSKTPLQEFVQREIYIPLRMNDTGYLPLAAGSRRGNEAESSANASATNPPPHGVGYYAQSTSKRGRVAPTEMVGDKPWRGVVHDPTARKMGGVAGHAGLFLTASDLARYARMLLNGGELDGVRIFRPETINLMTSVQTPAGVPARRGLGWDIDSNFSLPRGKVFPLGSYGHTGWTGTSLWIDPHSKTFVIFLSNRNHPNESGNVQDLRAKLGTLAAEAVADFDFANVSGALAASGDIAGTNSASHFPSRKTGNR